MTISVALPGPNGTTTLIGFEGYLLLRGDLDATDGENKQEQEAQALHHVFRFRAASSDPSAQAVRADVMPHVSRPVRS
jgi:hypothetical protein